MKRNHREHENDREPAGLGRRWVRDMAVLIAGIGIGSGMALLLAPTSGEEARHTIGRGYRKTVKTIGRCTEDLGDRAEDLLEHVHHLHKRGSRLFLFGRTGGASPHEA